MKSRFLTALLFILPALSFSQWSTITFETNSQYIKIDTSQPNNIWQIGKPQKVFFDSAYSKTKAILTDSINPYPVNNLSSFRVAIKRPGPFGWMSYDAPTLSFYHKFDTDSLKDGGYIETSYDGGLTWTNIWNDANINSFYQTGLPSDTISGGIHAYTGKSKMPNNQVGWTYCSVWWLSWCPYKSNPPDSIIFKFSFKSDNIQTNKEGWMIDNIQYYTMCPFEVNSEIRENDFKIFPNPFSNFAVIKIANGNLNLKHVTAKIYNILSQEVFPDITSEPEGLKIYKGNLTPGIYFYNIHDGMYISESGKMIIE